MMKISVIVTTYNWTEALTLCLESLFAQDDECFEIVVADDGSSEANVAMANSVCQGNPRVKQYVHHEDLGFRAATIRNKAVAVASGDYILFVDGDCLLPKGFISRHRALAKLGYFVPGNRVLLSQNYTTEVLNQHINLIDRPFGFYWTLARQAKINRAFALLKLPLGPVRYCFTTKWQQAMTCNLALWKEDFIKVNGFDEAFQGWGYEDSDLVIRLIHAGIKRKEGRFAVTVLHLWHPQNDRSQHDQNYQRLLQRLGNPEFVLAEQGYSDLTS